MNKVGIELSVESGGFVSGIASAERAVESLTEAMKQAKEEGRHEDFVRLQIQRDTLKASTSGFNKDTQKLFNTPYLQTKTANGLAGIKLDSESGQLFKDLTSNIKKLSGVMAEQLNSGDFEGASKTAFQLQQEQGKYKKAVDAVAGPAGTQTAQNIQNLLKAIGIDKIATAINGGFSAWAGSLNRSGIINQYGSGDILGGQISEQRRQANMYGGFAQAGLGVVGTAAGFFLPGGPMVWGTIGAQVGQAIKTALGIEPDLAENDATYARLWGQRSSDAMNLTALMGRDAVMGDRNMVRETFNEAADAAAKFGYSAEEGMAALNQAVKQGLDGGRAREVSEKVFNYERSTGADRGTLSSVANMAARYGAGDALKAGWGGLGASGMSPGQYNEYLRGLQRVMEDSIGKGFVKSADQVAENFTMLAQMTGNNPLWQGENGARRLSEMNAGLESATGLKSTSDIVAYRAARNMPGGGGSYLNAMKILEGGLTPNLFNEYMRLTKNVEGGNKEATVERMRQTFGLSYTNATALYEGWKPGMSDASVKALVDQYKNNPLPNASSPELEWTQLTAQTANIVVQTGQIKFDESLPMLLEGRKKAENELREAMAGSKPYQPTDTTGMTPQEALIASQADYAKALKKGTNEEFEEAARNVAAAQAKAMAEMSMPPVDPYATDSRRLSQAQDMLMQSAWGKGNTFFTGDGNPFTKNDDERANDRLMRYEATPRGSDTNNAFWEAIKIMESFTEAERRKTNETNAINRAIPDVMTDKTGQQLLEELRNLKVNITVIP